MKKSILKIGFLSLLAVAVFGCDDGLDVVGGEMPTAVYMENDLASINITNEGGETYIEPRLAQLAPSNMQVVVSVNDFFEQYNQENGTKYRALPSEEYQLYEVSNPKNTSTKGQIAVTIKKGEYSSKIGVKVKPLDEEKYPFGYKYAIPLSISSSSAERILSNKRAVVTFNREFKTDVMKIKQGYGLKIKLAENIKPTKEFTVQGQFMFLGWASQNQTTMVVGGYYTRVNGGGIQVKDGGGDGPATWWSNPMEQNRWYQITFTFKDNIFKVYLNGKLVKTFERTKLEVTPGQLFHLFNPQRNYSASQYVREVRLWNRVLTEKEINDDLYLPVDPNSEGLLMYLPLDKKNKLNNIAPYENEVMPKQGEGLNHKTIEASVFEANAIEWVNNVKFPADKLEVVN